MNWDEKVIQVIAWNNTELIALTTLGNLFLGRHSYDNTTKSVIVWIPISKPS